MPITHDDLPFVSPQLLSGIAKGGAAFRKSECRGISKANNPLLNAGGAGKTVDVKPNSDGDGVVFITTTIGFAPKDSVVEETKEGSSLDEYYGFVLTVCKAAGREDMKHYIFGKVKKFVKSQLKE